jgi:hypothetical protein
MSGLPPNLERVYQHVLRHPGKIKDISNSEYSSELRELIQLGHIHMGTDDGYVAREIPRFQK